MRVCARHDHLTVDTESDARVGLAQRLLDACGIRAAREDEPEIAAALGKGHEDSVSLGGNADVVNGGHDPRGVEPFHTAKNAPFRNGNHHDARRARSTLVAAHITAHRMSEQHLFE